MSNINIKLLFTIAVDLVLAIVVKSLHIKREATGSKPVDGSSKYTEGGAPIRAMAKLTLRRFPPL